MIYSIFKNQVSIRNGSWILPTCAKSVSFCRISSLFVVRYESGIAGKEQSFSISYLINTLGLSPQSALSVSKKIHFETSEQPDTVISFLMNHGFSKPQIRSIIQKWPASLLCNPEKTLLPKFQFFYSKRISGVQLLRILSSNPDILRYSLDNRIIPNFNALKEFTRCNDDQVFSAYRNYSNILSCDFRSMIAPNLAIVKECGMPEPTIMVELVLHPRAFVMNPDKFRITVEEVKKLGFDPLKRSFLTALQAFFQISKSSWDKKTNVLKQWGWSNEVVLSAFVKYPRFMMYSEQKITAVMSFFVHTMGWKALEIAKHPVLISFSLERRIIPRCSVLQALLSKGLIEKFNICFMLKCTEKEFLQRFVIPYEDAYLLKLYEQQLGL
ncbi:hypothetical protein F3Y22_tig00110388pilonHSYRG00221 [Hibiscus syriacus]|uniref:Mitochondrial transcription termination factor family protein n=1 Tax=Hibiscus syriacus TaxID=106335 RepID=A0A6A3AR92_HIBSY|nr:uncharacterized protein LOC120122951 [Hibiscus syriacus]KAE8706766.1 hypothetical protein F3Y22_tig00110388pilonHSYRG00221 [Hibiscus syriacus]